MRLRLTSTGSPDPRGLARTVLLSISVSTRMSLPNHGPALQSRWNVWAEEDVSNLGICYPLGLKENHQHT